MCPEGTGGISFAEAEEERVDQEEEENSNPPNSTAASKAAAVAAAIANDLRQCNTSGDNDTHYCALPLPPAERCTRLGDLCEPGSVATAR